MDPRRRGRPQGRSLDGDRVRWLREELYLSQVELAEACQLSADTVQRAEAGKPVGLRTIGALVRFFLNEGFDREIVESIKRPR